MLRTAPMLLRSPRLWGAVCVMSCLLGLPAAAAQAARPAPSPDPAHAPAGPSKPPPAARTPPPRPQTDWEKATALAKKHQYDQACPLFEKVTHTVGDNAGLWNELAQCEAHRGHKKQAAEAAQRSVVLGDRAQRRASYLTLHAVGAKVELPDRDCEWLPEMPGSCDEQIWACAYPWEQHPSAQRTVGGRALTFGTNDDEHDQLEQALRDNTALRDQLAMEWKALTVDRVDERSCSACHAQAAESADGLVTARASACFQQKTGHPPPANICVQSDSDCDVFDACLDEASALAHRSETSRSLWPEASDVISAAHKVCDATCGVTSKTTCDVVAFDACRGFVGYACVKRERGRRPELTIGEIAVDDAKSNWSEVQLAPPPPPAATNHHPGETPPPQPGHTSSAGPPPEGAPLARHQH